MSKRLLPLSFIAGLLGALAFAIPASAATYTGNCVVQGTATTPGVQVIGGTGTFSFQASLLCSGRDASNPAVNEVGDVNANSSGTYNNVVCGTGTADSTANSLASPPVMQGGTSTLPAIVLGNDLPTAAYHIGFTGGQGIFSWRPGSSITGTSPDPDPNAPAGSTFGGDISISATGDGASTTICTHHFTVTGLITGTESG